MINVDGYKAFSGIMRFIPKSKCVPQTEIKGDWLYRPDTKCWHNRGIAYPENMCKIIKDESVWSDKI